MYRIETLLGAQSIRRLSDGASIPIDPPKEMFNAQTGETFLLGGNTDYADYLAWVEKGNTTEEVDLTPVKSLAERRQAEYVKQGASTDALVVALWEQIVEDRPESADALQAIREQVKLDIPKE